MTGYTPNNAFTGAEIYDLTDPVLGGSSGAANVPLKALADQGYYLKNRLYRWEGIKTLTGGYTMDPVADLGQLFAFQIAANTTFTLCDVSLLVPGTRVPINTQITGIKALTVLAHTGQNIVDGSEHWLTWDTAAPGIYMHDAETLILVAATDHWIVETKIGNFDHYGESYAARFQARNTLIENGTIYNRADVPRLALIAGSGATCVTDDTTWNSGADPTPNYRGLFSTGNGTTTLRVPDSRGLTDKYLDLGRGLDPYRVVNFPGGFEDEQVGTHDHPTHGKGGIIDGITGGVLWFLGITGLDRNYTNNPGGANQFGRRSTPDTTMRTGNNNGGANITKNNGKIPLVKI